MFTRVGLRLTFKHQTRPERPAWGKYFGLLQVSVYYKRKKFYNIGLRVVGQAGLVEGLLIIGIANVVSDAEIRDHNTCNL